MKHWFKDVTSPMPSCDRYQQNVAQIHHLTSMLLPFQNSYRLFIRCEQMAVSAFVTRHKQRHQWMWSVAYPGCSEDVWDDFLFVEQHLRPHIQSEIIFKGGGWSCSSFSPRGRVQLGQSGRVTPPARLHPIAGPPGALTQAGPPSVFVTHCSPLYCNTARFTTAAVGHLVLQWLPPVFEGVDHSQNWDPWYAHLSAALVAARHVMWQTKLCTQYYLKFPIKDVQKECMRRKVVIRFFHVVQYGSEGNSTNIKSTHCKWE